jgi:hypothetical protein
MSATEIAFLLFTPRGWMPWACRSEAAPCRRSLLEEPDVAGPERHVEKQ